MLTLQEKLVAVQSAIKAPKNKNNDFGGYKYRSAEQIFEAFKPYGADLGLSLIVSDDVVQVGNFVYVRATAVLTDMANPADRVTVTAWAREQESKKGMDAAQVTGSASSYARKYALNGLFLLDDTKDPDTNEYRKESDARRQKAEQDDRDELISEIRMMAADKGYEMPKGVQTARIEVLRKALEDLKKLPSKKGAKA